MSLLPPLLVELMSNGKKVVADLAAVDAAVTRTEAKTATATTKMQAAFNRTAAAGKIIGAGVLIAGAVIVGESAKMATDFQSKMNLLTAAAGESKKNMKTVSEGILNLAGATGTSVDQLSEGMYTVEKSGNRGADGLKILKAAAQGAKAENVDLATATNALTSVMMSYHAKSSDAVKIQNELIAGSGMAKTTMQNYAGSLATVVPIASAAGIGFDQVGGAIATLTQHGTSAQEATQELANTIRNLQAPNAVASQAMQQLGLDSVDVAAKLGERGLTGTIGLVTDAISKKMGPSGLVVVDAFKQSQAASADLQTMLSKMPAGLRKVSESYFAGNTSLKDYRTTVKDMGGQSAAMGMQFLGLAQKTQGFNNMVKQGNPAAQTFSGYLKQVMGGATGLNTALQLGGENMGYFKKATDAVGEAGKKTGANVSTWAQTQKTLKVQLDQAGASIQATGVRLGTVLLPGIANVLKAGSQFVQFLVKNPPLLITIASIIGGILAGAIAAYIAKLTIAAVVSAVQFAKMIASASVWVATQVAAFARAVAAGAVWLAQSLAQFAEWAAKQAAVLASAAVMWVRYAGMVIAENGGIIATLRKGIAAGASWLAAQTVQLAKSGALWAAAKAKMVASLIAENAAMVAQKAVMVAGAVATGIATAAQWAFNVAADANPIGLIVLAIAALIAIVILLVTHWKQVTSFLVDAWGHVASFFQTIGAAIAKWWTGLWNGIVNFVLLLWNSYLGMYVHAFEFLRDAFVAIGGAISRWWTGFWNGIVSFVSSVWNGQVKIITAAFQWVHDQFVGIGRAVSSWWGGFWSGLVTTAQSIFKGVSNFVIGIFNHVIDAINGVISGLNSIAGGLKNITGGAINFSLGKIPHLPSFDVGGTIPGAPGQPLLMIGHGGEVMLSRDMLAGRQHMPQQARQAIAQAPSSRSDGNAGSSPRGRGAPSIGSVHFHTNASPARIQADLGWILRRQG